VICLLDTNACIQLWRRTNLKARAHFQRHKPADIAICSMVKAELLFGALRREHQEQNPQSNFMIGLPTITHSVSEFSRVKGLKIEDWEV
jgi:predicted nucleic acid-binding protein